MAEKPTQNQNDSPNDSLIVKILGAIIPVSLIIMFTYQMVESFFQK